MTTRKPPAVQREWGGRGATSAAGISGSLSPAAGLASLTSTASARPHAPIRSDPGKPHGGAGARALSRGREVFDEHSRTGGGGLAVPGGGAPLMSRREPVPNSGMKKAARPPARASRIGYCRYTGSAKIGSSFSKSGFSTRRSPGGRYSWSRRPGPPRTSLTLTPALLASSRSSSSVICTMPSSSRVSPFRSGGYLAASSSGVRSSSPGTCGWGAPSWPSTDARSERAPARARCTARGATRTFAACDTRRSPPLKGANAHAGAMKIADTAAAMSSLSRHGIIVALIARRTSHKSCARQPTAPKVVTSISFWFSVP